MEKLQRFLLTNRNAAFIVFIFIHKLKRRPEGSAYENRGLYLVQEYLVQENFYGSIT